jgi:hypothetical protein
METLCIIMDSKTKECLVVKEGVFDAVRKAWPGYRVVDLVFGDSSATIRNQYTPPQRKPPLNAKQNLSGKEINQYSHINGTVGDSALPF